MSIKIVLQHKNGQW